jgi:hypothetical protein
VATIALFFLGWILYGMLLQGYMAANTNQAAGRPMEEMLMWSIVLSNLCWGVMLALVNSWSGSLSFTSGMQKGLLVGLFSSLGFNFAVYSMSTYYMNISALMVDAVSYAVITAIAAGLAGWAMGRSARPAAAAV